MESSDDLYIGIGIGIAAVVGLILIVLLIYFLRKYFEGGQFRNDNIRLFNKVIIVTGCNTGIGKETVLDLAKRGAKIYMACRDRNKCEAARKEIVEKTGNENIISRYLDLSSLQSVRDFAEGFLKEENSLDILINNAGIMATPKGLTKDGFETQIGVNFLGHFLLTNLLLDILKASAPSQIIHLSSSVHFFGKINKEDFNSEKSYSETWAYCQSKLANVLFSRELAKRLQGTGVTSNSLHPGAVSTELQRHASCVGRIGFAMTSFFFKTPKSGAQTTLAVAMDPKFKDTTGKYFSDCKIVKESKRARDDDTALWLWDKGIELTGLNK